MNGKKRAWFILAGVDFFLLGVAAVLFAVGASLLRLSPTWWGYFLVVLDIQIWPPWKLIGVVMILAEGLLVIRHWPSKKQRRSTEAK